MNTMAQIATSTLPAVLAISGSDSSGGAGMQADLKTMLACGVFGMSAITALTAQNTTGVRSIQDTKPDILADQINMVFEDIPPVAVKIGMVSATDIIDVIAERLTFHHATNIVLDPVMVATSGAKLISDDAIAALTGKLFPMATVVTPNIPEAEVLTDTLIRDQGGIWRPPPTASWSVTAVPRWSRVVMAPRMPTMCFAETDGTVTWFDGARINNLNTHGTGCTLSSAIASYLALGDTLPKAIKHAKKYL